MTDELCRKAREYGTDVVTGDRWPLDEDDVDLDEITWETSSRAKRRHGRASYETDGRVTITISEHTYERAGFAACEETIRHELVHAWQHQQSGELAVVTDDGVVAATYRDDTGGRRGELDDRLDDLDDRPGELDDRPVDLTARYERGDESVVRATTGHGDSFRAWIDPLDLDGRCSTHYEKTEDDYSYVYECPECGNWTGKHRLCKSVRQAAHGDDGPAGYRYCLECEALLRLRRGATYLAHGEHDDDDIRAFARGDDAELSTVPASDAETTWRPRTDE